MTDEIGASIECPNCNKRIETTIKLFDSHGVYSHCECEEYGVQLVFINKVLHVDSFKTE